MWSPYLKTLDSIDPPTLFMRPRSVTDSGTGVGRLVDAGWLKEEDSDPTPKTPKTPQTGPYSLFLGFRLPYMFMSWPGRSQRRPRGRGWSGRATNALKSKSMWGDGFAVGRCDSRSSCPRFGFENGIENFESLELSVGGFLGRVLGFRVEVPPLSTVPGVIRSSL